MEELSDDGIGSERTSPSAHSSQFSAYRGNSLRPNADISSSNLSSEYSEAEKIIEEDELIASRPYKEEQMKKDFYMQRIVVDSPKDNTKEPFEVRIDVIEAEIQRHGLTEKEINVALRVYLEGQCRSVLTHSGTATPSWNETLSFTIEKELTDLGETELEFKMYGMGGLFRRDRLWGSFVCDLYTIYCSDGHCIVRKWFPLTSALSNNERKAENDYEGMSALCGFLKMSVCIRRLHHTDANIGLSSFEEVTDDEREMVFTDSLLHHTMTVRVYKLCQLDPAIIHYDHPHTHLVIQVQVGKEEAFTHAVRTTSESANVNEEIYLRLLWPTVARKVIFRILGKNRTEPLAEAVLNLAQCQGDDDCGRCLPLFGPAFVNFLRTGEPGEPSAAVRFVGRALVEFDCTEDDRVRDRCSVPDEEAKYADYIQGKCEYVLLCSFFDANYIHPMFRKRNISFNISLGPFGNTAYNTTISAHRTISATPAYSGTKYYGITWGNQKPVCEIQCAWENIERRIGRCNAIHHIANMVDSLVDMAVRETGGCGAIASHICNALHRSSFLLDFIIESMLMYTSWLVKLDRRTREKLSFAANTRLDSARMMLIKSKACEIQAMFRRFRFRFDGTRSIIEIALDRLRNAARLLNSLAVDSQISIPHVLITMNDGSESLAYAKVPITEVFYSSDRNLKGTYCGYTHAVAMEQICIKADENKHSDTVCIISTRMWFGRATHRMKFEHAIRPARIRYVAEVFENQTLNSDGNWEHVEGNWYSDEYGRVKLVEELNGILPPPRWVFTDDVFVPALCHQMWVGLDAGRDHFYDELFEIQELSDFKWQFLNFTGRHGDVIPEGLSLEPPPGWEWRDRWVVDRTRLTDPEGWVYSTQNNFDEDIIDTLDYVEHTEDRFRCRRLKRQRVIIADLARLIGSGRNSDSSCWERTMAAWLRTANEVELLPVIGVQSTVVMRTQCEAGARLRSRFAAGLPSFSAIVQSAMKAYARTLYNALHWQRKPDDKFRRRLMRREMKPPPVDSYPMRRNVGVRIQQDRRREDLSRSTEVDYNEQKDATEGRKTARRSKAEKDGKESNKDHDEREGAGIDKGNWRADCLPAGVYEVYDEASVWELRASILWGRDLLLDGVRNRRPFVRVVFRNRCIETAVVTSCINPVWVETLIFYPVLLCGSVRNLRMNPPPIIVEVRSDELDRSEPFLGRFITRPSTCCAHHGRPPAVWFPLQFPDGATRGAVLASFELFLHERNQECGVPPRPAKKNFLSNRYSADSSVCPLFGQYTVHVLSLGIRDYVSCSRLSAEQKAYVEVRIGDGVGRTDTVQHLKLNPNFLRPVLTLDSVALPKRLCYAPPLTFSLHQLSPFPFASAVAVCEVTSFAKYLRKVPQEYEDDDTGWRNFDRVLRDEEAIEAHMELYAKEESNSVIDWWSKYYASTGEKRRAPGFDESGIERLTVLECSLEDARNYHAFSDFVDTFTFVEPPSRKLELRASPTSRGQLRARIYIQEKRDKSPHDMKSLLKVFMLVSCSKPTVPLLETFPDSTPCVLRVYVVRAFNLVSRRGDGTCDPYISVRCGKHKASGKKEVRVKDLNPIFGLLIEMKVDIPCDNKLVISVLDRHRILPDCEIGHTEIDLEKRLFTRYRATVGLSREYCISGLFPWRDNMSPLAILKSFCKRMNYRAPELLSVDENDATIRAFGTTYRLSEVCLKPHRRDGLLGRPLQRVALYILLQMGLVTEHVETRTLHGPTGKDTETGKLQMFVDLLPLHAGPIKPPLDISPRRPVQYQLRVVVWRVHGALLSKTTMGKKVADLYVKCFLEGSKNEERTDIHFHSVDGNASFNWRFVINFDYDIWEQKVVFRKKRRFSRAKIEHLRDPILKIQVCDNNRFQVDTLIGECSFDLREFPEAEIDSEGNPTNNTVRTHSSLCCINAATFCRQALCCTKGHRREFASLPRPVLYKPINQRTFSLFKQHRTCGWWPCLNAFFPHQTGVRYDALKKKDDDRTEETRYVTANVKLEAELLAQRDADELPVGRKRLEPNRCPYLPAPYRSGMDDHWCTSRLKAAASFFYHAYGRKCLLITAAFSLLVAVVFITIYRLPEKLLKRIFMLA